MPLNPDEVVNKRFSATKFRQGYDEEEVDEFLDEVVAELRRLNSENADLRSKLSTCESRVSELSRGAGRTQAAPTPTPAPTPAVAPTPAPEPTPAPVPTPVSAPAPVSAHAASGPESATGMLALAQKLHDEHVEAGRAESEKIVGDAQEHAARLVREAEDKQRETLGNLEQQRQVLERRVETLRSFEREYRSRLKAYLETQLRELESKGTLDAGRGESEAARSGEPAGSGGGSLQNRAGFTAQEPVEEGQPTQETPRFPFGG